MRIALNLQESLEISCYLYFFFSLYLLLYMFACAKGIYRSYAKHTSNTGIKPNPEAEVTTKTVDIVVMHLITNRIE